MDFFLITAEFHRPGQRHASGEKAPINFSPESMVASVHFPESTRVDWFGPHRSPLNYAITLPVSKIGKIVKNAPGPMALKFFIGKEKDRFKVGLKEMEVTLGMTRLIVRDLLKCFEK